MILLATIRGRAGLYDTEAVEVAILPDKCKVEMLDGQVFSVKTELGLKAELRWRSATDDDAVVCENPLQLAANN